MKRIYNIVILLLSAIVLSWVLPWLYNLCFTTTSKDPFVGWSPVIDRFVVSFTDDNDKLEIFDVDPVTGTKGRYWSREQRDSLMPEIYANQLSSKGLMPDSIKGMEMSTKNIRLNRWTFSSFPRNFNRSVPTVYPLMESMPARFDLEDPVVVLTMNDGVKITDIETNTLDTLKTQRFARMFADKGFQFPAREAHANITTRKAYDNGYLIIDDNRDIYHLKMQVNRPSMAKISKADSIVPMHVYVVENVDKLLYGFVATESDDLYALMRDNYRLVKLPGVKFNPLTDRLNILKGMFSWVIKKDNDEGTQWIALNDSNLEYLDEYSIKHKPSSYQNAAGYIFPFTTSYTSELDQKVYPRISGFSWHAIFFNIVLAVIILFLSLREPRPRTVIRFVTTIILGVYIFIPFLIIRH